MIKPIPFWLLLSLASNACADAPLRPPGDHRVKSANGRFEASFEVEPPRTTILDLSGGRREQTWSKQGFHRLAFVADDGLHLVACYNGLNLIPVDYSPDLVLLEFFEGPKSVRRVLLREIIWESSNLRKTVSHYHWGTFEGFSQAGHFAVETVEGRRLEFDVRSGRCVSAQTIQSRTAEPENYTSGSGMSFQGEPLAYTITRKDLLASPAWNPESESPPLSIADAIKIARRYLTLRFPRVTDWPTPAINILPVERTSHWYYNLRFVKATIDPQFSDVLDLPILMNGKVVPLRSVPEHDKPQ